MNRLLHFGRSFSCLFLFYTFPLFALAQLKGKAISITDGDTFTLLTDKNEQVVIRLKAVDAPEKGQDFSTAAKQRLSDLILKKEVMVQVSTTNDRYSRTVGTVTCEGVDISKVLLQEGLVWHFSQYDHNLNLEELEKAARKAKIGIWSLPQPIAPWAWRRKVSQPATQ